MTDAIGVAVVGAGFWGKNLVRNFAAIEAANLAWICDLDPVRLDAAAELAPAARPTTALADVLGDAAVQAVAVATPAEAHRDVSLACLHAGKHLFVEKPLATCTADATPIIDEAAARRLTLMVGHLFLYDPGVLRLIELVNGGRAGSIRYITSVRTSMSGTARLDTNIAWDALIHDAYVMTALVGRRPGRVLVNGRGYLSSLEDVAFATFDFGDGVLAQIYASWYALEKARKITVVGSDGILHLDEFADLRLAFYDRKYVRGATTDPRGRARWEWVDGGVEPQPLPPIQPLRAECEDFLACVRAGRTPKTSGREALQALQVVEACQRSLASDGAWAEVR